MGLLCASLAYVALNSNLKVHEIRTETLVDLEQDSAEQHLTETIATSALECLAAERAFFLDLALDRDPETHANRWSESFARLEEATAAWSELLAREARDEGGLDDDPGEADDPQQAAAWVRDVADYGACLRSVRTALVEGRLLPVRDAMRVFEQQGGSINQLTETAIRVSQRETEQIEDFHEELKAAFLQRERTDVLLSLLIVSAALLWSLFFPRTIARPLRHLGRVAHRMARGDLEARTDLVGKDEIGQLAHHFDEMAATVQSREAELKEALREAKIASQAKGEFLANMSHEVRTPLNGVLGMAELLGETELEAAQREMLETIESSGDKLLTIINSILDFSRLEADRVVLEQNDFKPGELLEELQEWLSELAGHKGIELLVSLDPGSPAWVRGDRERLSQVLLNLGGNAIKFSSSGTVVIRARELASDDTHSRWEFEVSDTGIGLSSEAQERIFEAFEQADGSATRGFGGAGLGLAISKHLVQAMGGELHVESELGRGSRFFFEISFARPSTAAGCEGQDTQTATDSPATPVEDALETRIRLEAQSLRILVVEDNIINQKVVCSMLRRIGCTAEVAQDGAVALRMLEDSAYDAILMDCQMPVMDGYIATAHIRADPGTYGRCPIIGLTASTLEGDRERCLAAGMDEYMSKPLRLERLCETLNRELLPD